MKILQNRTGLARIILLTRFCFLTKIYIFSSTAKIKYPYILDYFFFSSKESTCTVPKIGFFSIASYFSFL